MSGVGGKRSQAKDERAVKCEDSTAKRGSRQNNTKWYQGPGSGSLTKSCLRKLPISVMIRESLVYSLVARQSIILVQ
jgi:hypothetical protein